jgi:hypothetical protein
MPDVAATARAQLVLAWFHLEMTVDGRSTHTRLSTDRGPRHATPSGMCLPLVRACADDPSEVPVAWRHEAPGGVCLLAFSATRPLGYTVTTPLTLAYPLANAANLAAITAHSQRAWPLAA